MDAQRLLEHIWRRLEGSPQGPGLLARQKVRNRPDGVVKPRSSVGDMDLHARCTSFYPSISPRAACLFSLFSPLFSPTRCMSFQPFQPPPISPRAACLFSLTRCMSFQPCLFSLERRESRPRDACPVCRPVCLVCPSVCPRVGRAMRVLSAPRCVSCLPRDACPVCPTPVLSPPCRAAARRLSFRHSGLVPDGSKLTMLCMSSLPFQPVLSASNMAGFQPGPR
jgi:hypothetical protein